MMPGNPFLHLCAKVLYALRKNMLFDNLIWQTLGVLNKLPFVLFFYANLFIKVCLYNNNVDICLYIVCFKKIYV